MTVLDALLVFHIAIAAICGSIAMLFPHAYEGARRALDGLGARAP